MRMFEDFSATQVSGRADPVDDPAALKLEFDKGYKAGWSDGSASERDERAEALSQLSSALQELQFTYFEARAHILKSLHPFLAEISKKLLPRVAEASLVPIVQEAVQDLADKVEVSPEP